MDLPMGYSSDHSPSTSLGNPSGPTDEKAALSSPSKTRRTKNSHQIAERDSLVIDVLAE